MLVANNELSTKGWTPITACPSGDISQFNALRAKLTDPRLRKTAASPVPVFRPVPAAPVTKNTVKISAEDDGIARNPLATPALSFVQL